MKKFLFYSAIVLQFVLLIFASFVIIPLAVPVGNVWQSIVLLPYGIGALALGTALCVGFTVYVYKHGNTVLKIYQTLTSVLYLTIIGVVLYLVI